MKQKINIIWCKRNLRVQDNEILANIDPDIPTLGVYFFEPDIMRLPDYSDFHLQFVFESLLDLQKSYLKLGIPLLLLPYDALEGFIELEKYFEILQVFSHEETGNWETYKRDVKVLEYCKSKEINITEYETNGVVRRLKTRDSWDAIWTRRMSQDLHLAREIKNTLKIPPELAHISKSTKQKYKDYFNSVGNEYFHSNDSRNDNNRSLRIGNPYLQKGGEQEGQKILKRFLELGSAKYMYNISKPLESESWCSRLSPYIAYGCLSLKTVVQATEKRREELKAMGSDAAKNHRKSLQYFISRLHWQSHFIQKLEDEPSIQFKNLNPVFDTIRQKADNKLLDTIFKAQSGIPYIDAVIKQLQQTGWTNFRSRAVLVSFLCNTCMQPWQAVAPRIARLFTDYEPGIHYSQFQMQAGTTGINTIRIYNPVYNGQQKAPQGKFIYKYLPELKTVPQKYIHEPHLWEHFSSLSYTLPVVDIKENNKVARDLLWKTKGGSSREIKENIIKKHASRSFHGERKRKKRSIKNISMHSGNTDQTTLF